MNRTELIRCVEAAPVDPATKAATILGIAAMSKADLARFSVLADRGIALLAAKDYAGIMALLAEANAPPKLTKLAQDMIHALTGSDDSHPVG